MSAKVSPNVEPETRSFLEQANAQGGKPLYELTPQQARKVLSDLQAGEDVEKLPADIEDRTVPGGPGNKEVSVRIVRPRGRTDALPVLLHIHGGGWVLGDKGTHDRLIRELANGVQAAVVFVNYTPAPEAQYPVQLEEAYAVLKWVADNGESLHLDASRLAIVGDSVGGNMATVLTMLAKERGGPRIAFQLLFYPVTDARFDTGSYQELATGHFLEREGMKWFWDNYLPDKAKRAEPHASPLRASPEQLKGLPPALIIVGENDVLRDEVEAYAHKLARAGVRVTASRYLGTIHDFVMLNPITNTPAPRAAIRQAISTLRQVLGQEERAARMPARETEAPPPMTH